MGYVKLKSSIVLKSSYFCDWIVVFDKTYPYSSTFLTAAATNILIFSKTTLCRWIICTFLTRLVSFIYRTRPIVNLTCTHVIVVCKENSVYIPTKWCWPLFFSTPFLVLFISSKSERGTFLLKTAKIKFSTMAVTIFQIGIVARKKTSKVSSSGPYEGILWSIWFVEDLLLRTCIDLRYCK